MNDGIDNPDAKATIIDTTGTVENTKDFVKP